MEKAIVNDIQVPISDADLNEARALCEIMRETKGPVLAKAMELMSGDPACLKEYIMAVERNKFPLKKCH